MCQLEVEIERELESHNTQREKDGELHRARVHMQSVCRMYKLQPMKDGTSYMNTAKASCHGGKIASKKFRR